jgi:hypothetical protein
MDGKIENYNPAHIPKWGIQKNTASGTKIFPISDSGVTECTWRPVTAVFSVRHTRMILGALGIRFFVSLISFNLQTGQSTPRPTLKLNYPASAQRTQFGAVHNIRRAFLWLGAELRRETPCPSISFHWSLLR